jgi:hypothetical protein
LSYHANPPLINSLFTSLPLLYDSVPAPEFYLTEQLCRISGTDLTRIDGIKVRTAQTLISEVGVDMSRWRTEKQFASWLGLCPDNRISDGKVLKRGTRPVTNRAATALRMVAWGLLRGQSALGANFRRLRRKLGAPESDYSYGSQARSACLPNVEIRERICRQRSGTVRNQIPPTTGEMAHEAGYCFEFPNFQVTPLLEVPD